MSLSLFVSPKWAFQDDNGGNANGWELYTYEVGTTTPKVTYQDSEGSAANTNPIVLDARGEAEIWLDGNYKFVLKDDAGVTKWTGDNISGYGAGFQSGYLVKSVAGGLDVSLTAAEQNYGIIEFTGILTANINITVADDKDGYRWIIKNNTSGSFTITFKTLSGSGAIIDQGAEATIYHDGTNIVELFTITSFGKTLLDDATQTIARSTLGVVIGTDVQAWNKKLDSYSANTLTSANKIPYATALNTAGELNLSNDTTMVGDSATSVPTEHAVKTYVDTNDIKISGDIVQTVFSQTGAVNTGPNIIPLDDSIPQNNEGDQYMSVSITPTKSTNYLEITIHADLYHSAVNSLVIGALFQDTTANALAAAKGPYKPDAIAGADMPIHFTHRMLSGTTSTTTFYFRAGGHISGTTTFNGRAGSRYLGGVMASSITVKEYEA